MVLTLESLRRGRTLDLAGCFAQEAHLARKLFEHGEFIEGVRALIIDKDKTPRWNPPTIAQLDPARVQGFFNQTDDCDAQGGQLSKKLRPFQSSCVE